MTLGGRIARLRKERGLSQEALAELVGVSRQAVSKWELDEAQPDAAKIVLLAQALEVSTDQLLLGEGIPPTEPLETPPGASSSEGWAWPAALGRFIKKHGYKAGYLLIVYGLVLLLFAGGGLVLFHGFFAAADQSFSDSDFNGGWNNIQGDAQFDRAPGRSLSPEEIAIIERHHPEEHHQEYYYGALTPAQAETHAFPVVLQRAVYAVLAIPAILGAALVVTGIVIVVKYKGREE